MQEHACSTLRPLPLRLPLLPGSPSASPAAGACSGCCAPAAAAVPRAYPMHAAGALGFAALGMHAAASASDSAAASTAEYP
jgi:hypothetical protein